MEIQHIELNNLKLSALNVRKHGDKSGEDLKPSIRSKGVLQSLLVRKNCEGYEIISGQRRFNACKALVTEGEEIDALPCIIMEAGDDAAAIEASLAENMERLPMDEIDQYKAFTVLIEQGRDVQEIAAEFGVTERLVQQRLAIGNLYNPILNAYRREEINPQSLRYLTLATTAKQKAWWKLFKDDEAYVPTGHQLKAWLFGRAEIPTSNALFDLAAYDGQIVSNLFGDDDYFANADQFWTWQSKIIAERKEAYQAEGWQAVDLLEIGEHFMSWDYVHCDRKDGGEVFIDCSHDGEVQFHEGLISQKEHRRRQKQQAGENTGSTKAVRPEVTQSMQNYLELHRHNAVRVELLKQPNFALRLMVAHVIAGSDLWSIKPEPQKANTAAIDQSIANSSAQETFNAEAMEIRALLGINDGEAVIEQGWQSGRSLAAIFAQLLTLSDSDVTRILTFVMAESLQSGTGIIEQLGQLLAVDMHQHWQPDEPFFDLLRDKQAINAMVKELAGKQAADGNVTATAKAQKTILHDCLNGTRKVKVKDWQPRYMQFPMQSYTERGGITIMEQWAGIAKHLTG